MSDSARLLARIEHLNALGMALSAERDCERLLERILFGAQDLTGADGGSLYLLEDEALHFRLVRTISLGLQMGGSSSQPVTFPAIPLHLPDGSPNTRMVATRCALDGRVVNIPDAYAATGFDLSGTHAFDARTGYRSRSLLAVPLQDHEGRMLGVLQLINARDPDGGAPRPFAPADETLVASLASQAAVALSRQRLIGELNALLTALMRLVATAIDDKSPHTGGHCRRVPAITLALADAVSADDGPVFGAVRFSTQEREELEIAAWLHDCGKLTTPEHVIDKQTKLEGVFDRIALIEARLELLRRERVAADPDPRPELPDLDEVRAFLHRCNAGSEFLPEPDRARLAALATLTLASGEPLLTADELRNLAIPRGTLNPEERALINNHVAVSARMLATLPFPRHLRNVPLIAAGHHERMAGGGYPSGVPAGTLPLQARILALADIFEALTAADRGYRRANTLSQALAIMARMTREGHLDADLFELFLRRRVWHDHARDHLRPEQRDAIDEAALLAQLRE